jgi:hypoxanthine phosphoribosyltransferase
LPHPPSVARAPGGLKEKHGSKGVPYSTLTKWHKRSRRTPVSHLREGEAIMDTKKMLRGKMVLVVDDEEDTLDMVSELLEMCIDTA